MLRDKRRLSSMGRMPFLIAAACLTLVPWPARAEGDDALSGYAVLVRDILIVRQCGLSNELVEAGFRLEVESLAASQALTPEAAAAARERGQEVYRLAWRDRGSGPVDPRCRHEGAAAAAGFRAYILAD
jgi:hypothetical protein